MEVTQTLCWFCANAVPNPKTGAGCPWSKHFKPVPGWDAKPTRIQYYDREDGTTSYHVKSCPLFKPDSDPIISKPGSKPGTKYNATKCLFPDGKRIFYSVMNLTDGILFNTLDDACDWIVKNGLVRRWKNEEVLPVSVKTYLLKKNRESKTATIHYGGKEWQLIPRTSKGELRDEN